MVVGSLTITTDLAIIGGGPGGYVAAIRAAQLGIEVTLIEQEKELGGICLNHGCIPTKALIHATQLLQRFKDAESMGISAKDISLDSQKLQEWKRQIVTKLNQGIAGLLTKYNIEVITGKAVFSDQHTLRIEGKSDVNTIKFKHAIIATGSTPAQIPTLPFGGRIISSTEALQLDKTPGILTIVGGGYIGTELATVFARLGSQVHLIELQGRILPAIEEELIMPVLKKLHERIAVRTSTGVTGFEEKEGKIFLHLKKGDQKGDVIEDLAADLVLIVVGRMPNTKNLGLEQASIALTEKGFIKVNSQMQTNIPHIYAIGDCVGEPMLAHKASREGKIAAEVIAGQPSAFDNATIPYVIYNDPEIAGAGMTESEARAKGLIIKTSKFPFAALGRALTLNEPEGFVRMVVEEKTERILGVFIVGPNASDLISEAALAIEMGATAEDLAATIHPHPTLPESMMEAAELVLGKGIHIYTGNKKL